MEAIANREGFEIRTFLAVRHTMGPEAIMDRPLAKASGRDTKYIDAGRRGGAAWSYIEQKIANSKETSVTQTLGYLVVDSEGHTTIPGRMRTAMGLVPGARLKVECSDSGAFTLTPVTFRRQDQSWFFTPEIQERIVAAEEDFRAGRFTRTRGRVRTQRFLDSLKGNA